MRYRRLTLWENHLQCLNQQLNPGVLPDRQQRNDFRASRNDDGNNSGSGGIHEDVLTGFTVRRLSLPANGHFNLTDATFQIGQPLFAVVLQLLDVLRDSANRLI